MAVKKLPFEKIFPYFSYRWRYIDGEYSPYAPFSKVAFFPKDPNVKDFFKKGHNTSIANKVESINLSIPKGGPDVVAVDILYTESISSTVYVIKTIEIPKAERGDGSFIKYQITERSFGSALPNNQLSRQFDNVPLKAKSQEITANRLIYGNYTHQFPQNELLEIELGQIDLGKDPLNGPSVKSNRTYDIGVAFIDKYGRVGNIIKAAQSVIKTDFSTKYTQALTAKIKQTTPNDLGLVNSDGDIWAKYYRYYVKDVAGEHFNLSGFNIYNDGLQDENNSDNVYIQFNSNDRNKITEDTILIPRRHNFNGSDEIFTIESRHPVLAIENEAPDVVKNQIKEKAVASINGLVILDDIGQRVGIKLPSSITGLGDDATDITDAPSPHPGTTQAGDTTLAVADTTNTFATQIAALNTYIRSQSATANLFSIDQGELPSNLTDQILNVSGFGERLVLKFKGRGVNASSFDTDFCLVDSIKFSCADSQQKRNVLVFTLSNRLSSEGNPIAGTGLSVGGHIQDGGDSKQDLKFYKLGISEEGKEKLKGSFFVKVPRKTADSSIEILPTGQTPFDEDGNVEDNNIKEINFETEPIDDSNINIYYEGSRTYNIENMGGTDVIEFANCVASCISNGKVYLESRKIFDKFNTVEIAKGIRVNTPVARYAEETRKAGLIFSGLYNSRTGLNELNQFSMADGITKELEPNYGGIQKLYTLDTNLIAFAEDKVFRILADKDALFNADEGVNVTATNLVLGQAMVYQGDYGISTHPESFAFFRNNIYFTDAKRGNVLQLTPANGQIFPISSRGMSNFFRDRIGTASKLIGAYDGYKKIYVLSMQGYDQTAASIGSETIPNETSNITLGYSLVSEGWTSRYSFIPESGVTVNNQFYTFKDGKAYLHNSDTANRNNFYGVAYNSEVQVIFNDNPTFVSDWLSLNYDGSEGWEVVEIIGDQDNSHSITNVRLLDSEESGFLGWFLKEGKYHGAIVGTQPVYIIDPSATQPGSDGFWPLIQDGANTQDISGTKGFFQKTRFRNSGTTAKELFAVSSEYYISQT